MRFVDVVDIGQYWVVIKFDHNFATWFVLILIDVCIVASQLSLVRSEETRCKCFFDVLRCVYPIL